MDLTLSEKKLIFDELINKTSVKELLDIIDRKLLTLYNSPHTKNKITFSKAKTFISKTRTALS